MATLYAIGADKAYIYPTSGSTSSLHISGNLDIQGIATLPTIIGTLKGTASYGGTASYAYTSSIATTASKALVAIS